MGDDKMKQPWLKKYEPHVPQTIRYPEIPVHRWLLDTADGHPDDVAISFNETHFTYREMNEELNGRRVRIELTDGRDISAKEVEISGDSVSWIEGNTTE